MKDKFLLRNYISCILFIQSEIEYINWVLKDWFIILFQNRHTIPVDKIDLAEVSLNGF